MESVAKNVVTTKLCPPNDTNAKLNATNADTRINKGSSMNEEYSDDRKVNVVWNVFVPVVMAMMDVEMDLENWFSHASFFTS